jgi:hypothetical protein
MIAEPSLYLNMDGYLRSKSRLVWTKSHPRTRLFPIKEFFFQSNLSLRNRSLLGCFMMAFGLNGLLKRDRPIRVLTTITNILRKQRSSNLSMGAVHLLTAMRRTISHGKARPDLTNRASPVDDYPHLETL